MGDLRAEAPEDKRDVLCSDDPYPVLSETQAALLRYAEKLTATPAACSQADVEMLREVGATDVEIHALVQIAAYFNYINRVADALGVDLEPEFKRRTE